MSRQDKPVIWKSILLTFPCFLFYDFIYFVAGFVVASILWLLSRVELLKIILNWIFFSRGDSPLMFSICFAVTIAYYATSLIQKKIIKHFPTLKLSRIILGSIIIISNILFLFINFSQRNSIFANVICALSGIVFICTDNEE